MRIGCGCVNLGSASSQSSTREQIRLVQRAFEAGVTVFDTADIYGGGASEQLLGAALGARRAEVTISTKGGYVFRSRSRTEQRLRRTAAIVKNARTGGKRPTRSVGRAGPGTNASSAYQDQDFSPAALRRAIHASLGRLRTDHIDVFQLHGPRDIMPDLFAELDDLRRDGVVGRWGVGSESHESARDWCADGSIEVIQVAYGLLDSEANDRVLPLARKRSIDVWARGVLGGGVLNTLMLDPEAVADHPKRAMLRELVEVGAQAGLQPDELAIRWVTSSDHVATMLLGMSSETHLDRNLELAHRSPLDSDVVAAIDAVITGSTAQ